MVPRSASDSTDSTLLHRVKASDPAAWERLVDWVGPLILHWCRLAGLHHEDADDIFQEVFRKVFKGIATFQAGPDSSFRGWLRIITRNVLSTHFRRIPRQSQAQGGDAAQEQLLTLATRHLEDEDATADAQANLLLLRRALDLIRGDFEDHVWKAFWETTALGRSAPEVATELGMTPGAVRQAKARVRQRLREEFADLLE